MTVTTSSFDLPAQQTPMRTLVAEPNVAGGSFSGLLLFADVFALSEPTVRAAVRLAGYGFVVAVPEFYHRTEPPGTVIPFADREHAFKAAGSTSAADFDADTRTVLDWLAKHPRVRKGALGVTGFCIGGHLAVRAALQPDVAAAVAFYPTGLHENALGAGKNVDTLARVAAGGVKGRIHVVFGTQDAHVPLGAITNIHDAFAASGSRYTLAMYDGEHAFMRDEGERWNPSETDRAYREATDFFRETLGPIG